MKIVSWNCLNGFNCEKQKAIFKEFNEEEDIFVIQECKRADIFDLRKKEWKFINWYGDDHDYKSELGIAVLSKKYEIKFTKEFNRKFRYVVPYEVIIGEGKSFVLFAVWTKSAVRGEYDYDKNVIEAILSLEYKELLKNTLIIGDYNTGLIKGYEDRYTKLFDVLEKKGFINSCDKKPDEFIETFYYDNNERHYINDFCFISKNFIGKNKEFKVFNNWKKDNEKDRWNGSDHCPIEIKFDIY